MFKCLAKKIICLILCMAVLICSFPLNAFAQEEIIELTLKSHLSGVSSMRGVEDYQELADSINEQLKNFESRVDIYDFKILNTAENQKLIVDILSGGLPECFHIDLEFGIGTKGQYISSVVPDYIYSKAEYEKMLDECDAAADKMLEGIEGNIKLSEVEKLLLLHDRIAVACEYDYERYLMGQIPLISHSMYGVFVNGVAVCQGYALAYSYLLDRIGIENYYCGSEALYHAWNIVYVDGKPYHVDITSDDIVWDITGRVSHDYFLVSTQKIRENGHSAYDFDSSPTDTTYDNYFWQNSETEFVLLDDEIYYIDSETDKNNRQYVLIKRYSDKKTLYKTEHYWYERKPAFWSGNYARLSTDSKDLLFSLSNGIYKFDLEKGDAELIHKPVLTSFFSVYGFTYRDGTLIYDLALKPYFDENTKKLYEHEVPYTKEEPLPYTPGDIDNNQEVNLQDVVVLAQVLAEWDVAHNESALDVNGDGDCALTDVVHLAQYVADWEGIELH